MALEMAHSLPGAAFLIGNEKRDRLVEPFQLAWSFALISSLMRKAAPGKDFVATITNDICKPCRGSVSCEPLLACSRPDAPDPVHPSFGKPKGMVWSNHDISRVARGCGEHILGDGQESLVDRC